MSLCLSVPDFNNFNSLTTVTPFYFFYLFLITHLDLRRDLRLTLPAMPEEPQQCNLTGAPSGESRHSSLLLGTRCIWSREIAHGPNEGRLRDRRLVYFSKQSWLVLKFRLESPLDIFKSSNWQWTKPSRMKGFDALEDSISKHKMLKGPEDPHIGTVPYYYCRWPFAVSTHVWNFIHTFPNVILPKLMCSVLSHWQRKVRWFVKVMCTVWQSAFLVQRAAPFPRQAVLGRAPFSRSCRCKKHKGGWLEMQSHPQSFQLWKYTGPRNQGFFLYLFRHVWCKI